MTEDEHSDYWKKRGKGLQNISHEDVDAYVADHDHDVSHSEIIDFFEYGQYEPESDQPELIKKIADKHTLEELKDAITPEPKITEDSKYFELTVDSIPQYADLKKLAEEHDTELEVDISRQDSHILKTQGYLDQDQYPDLYLRDPEDIPFVEDTSGGFRVSEQTFLRLGRYDHEMLPIRFTDSNEDGRVKLYYAMSQDEVERYRGV